MAQHLTGEERIAGSLSRDLPGKCTPIIVELVPRHRLHQRRHILEFESCELETLHSLLA